MSDDPIDRLRAHVEKHKHRTGLYVSTSGVTALFDECDRWKAHAIGLEHKVSALKAQVERLLGKEGKRIGEALVHNHELRREQGGD